MMMKTLLCGGLENPSDYDEAEFSRIWWKKTRYVFFFFFKKKNNYFDLHELETFA